MQNTRYRRHRMSGEMARYALLMAEDNTEQLRSLRENLARALQEEVTPRQRQMMTMYYGSGMTMAEIGRRLEVERSTVSRTLQRGEDRLRRCLRYGAGVLLEPETGRPRRRQRGIDKRQGEGG